MFTWNLDCFFTAIMYHRKYWWKEWSICSSVCHLGHSSAADRHWVLWTSRNPQLAGSYLWNDLSDSPDSKSRSLRVGWNFYSRITGKGFPVTEAPHLWRTRMISCIQKGEAFAHSNRSVCVEEECLHLHCFRHWCESWEYWCLDCL